MILRWLPIAAGALAGALLAGGVQQLRVMHVQRALSDARSEYMARVTDAQAQHVLALAEARRIDAEATARERELTRITRQLEQEAHDAQIQRDIELAAADDAADGLRAAVARAEASARDSYQASANTTTAGQCTTALDSLRVLAQLLGESDGRAGVYAKQADRSRAAGLACEAAYEAVSNALRQ